MIEYFTIEHLIIVIHIILGYYIHYKTTMLQEYFYEVKLAHKSINDETVSCIYRALDLVRKDMKQQFKKEQKQIKKKIDMDENEYITRRR